MGVTSGKTGCPELAWSRDIVQGTEKRYPMTSRARVACAALARGKDPLLEIAKVGIERHYESLSGDMKETYALRFCKAAIKRITRETITQALGYYRKGDNLAAAEMLCQGSRLIPINSFSSFHTLWRMEMGSVRDIDLSVESCKKIIKARGDAFRAMESVSNLRWEEITNYVPINTPNRPYYEMLERIRDGLVRHPDGLLLESLRKRVSLWSCAD